MTDRTLREKINDLMEVYDHNGGTAFVVKEHVLAILDAHAAPPAIADAPVSDRPGHDAVAEAIITDAMVQAVIDHRVRMMRSSEANPRYCACMGPAAIKGRDTAVRQCVCVRSTVRAELEAALAKGNQP